MFQRPTSGCLLEVPYYLIELSAIGVDSMSDETVRHQNQQVKLAPLCGDAKDSSRNSQLQWLKCRSREWNSLGGEAWKALSARLDLGTCATRRKGLVIFMNQALSILIWGASIQSRQITTGHGQRLHPWCHGLLPLLLTYPFSFLTTKLSKQNSPK